MNEESVYLKDYRPPDGYKIESITGFHENNRYAASCIPDLPGFFMHDTFYVTDTYEYLAPHGVPTIVSGLRNVEGSLAVNIRHRAMSPTELLLEDK